MPTIDQNTRQLGQGLIQGATLTLPFACNANGELLIEIIPVNSIGNLNASPENIPIDENTRQVGAAITDDVSETITPITVDLVVDFPCVRVEIV